MADLKLYQSMMSKLKQKFHSEDSSYADKLQILTLSPFSIKRTMEEFEASNYLVKQSRKLFKETGVLAQRKKLRKGKRLDDNAKEAIRLMYENDDYSRIMPGKKDCKSVRNKETGQKERKQKRLLLLNLKELYKKYKEEKKPYVGFSTFASLRPPWCVLAGPKGTHNVCVCTHHQNPKLMISALPDAKKFSLQDIMAKTVCNIKKEDCMMRLCKDCPGPNAITTDHEINETLELQDEVEYKQWVSTDKTNLITLVESSEEYLENLAKQCIQLTKHHFTAESQSEYLKTLKEKLSLSDAIIQGDFAENYSFIVQDAAQGFHWENTQATLHPFVVYFKEEEGNLLAHDSYCVISDSREHSTAAVHLFVSKLLAILKEKLPHIKKIHYFTDGCAAQYKNRFNFINLCHHEDDFQLKCEWNFFATSHGKGPCDGIGGTVKRLAAKASLQRPINDQILTPIHMFRYCQSAFDNITFIFASSEEVQSSSEKLQERFDSARTLKGTQKLHRFVPISHTQLEVYSLSSGTSKVVTISQSESDEEISDARTSLEYKIGDYVACIYDGNFWFGLIEESTEEFDDYFIRFMHPSGRSNEYSWPKEDDECWVASQNILCSIQPPSVTSVSARSYKVRGNEITLVENIFKKNTRA